jgi:vitamin B12 transporter
MWLRIAWFRDRLENEIDGFVFDPAAGGFTAANRAGTSRREGLELASALPIAAYGTLHCDYTYLDATERADGRQVDEIRRPRHSGGCVADLAGARTSVQLGIVYTGARRDSDFATFPATPVTLDGYWLGAASLRFNALEWLTLVARIDNAFDDRYEDVFGYDTAGRRFTVGFQASLD